MTQYEHLNSETEITFREITRDTVRQICNLSHTLSDTHRKMVADNAVSIAQAHFEPKAWFRAIYAHDEPVGFVMLFDNPEKQEYFLWRFMIAGSHHGKGYGKQAIEKLLEYVRSRPGATQLVTSCGTGEGSPEGFYLKLGFRPTGKWEGDEIVLQLDL